MLGSDAERKFFEAVHMFKKFDDRLRQNPDVDEKSFRMVIVDLDAVIPGLSGLFKGRALMLKGLCLDNIHTIRMIHDSPLVYDLNVAKKLEPIAREAHKCIKDGHKILMKENISQEEKDWVDDVLRKTAI
jgi:hypothetical protein